MYIGMVLLYIASGMPRIRPDIFAPSYIQSVVTSAIAVYSDRIAENTS